MPEMCWQTYYATKMRPALYPEGWVVRALLSGFPEPMLTDRDFAGRRAVHTQPQP